MSADIDPNLQCMWDALGILGFDLDGDPSPEAAIAGMSAVRFRDYFLSCVTEIRQDSDTAADEAACCGVCQR